MINWAQFSPKALDFLENSDARLNILHGSVRSSKTVNCSIRWLQYCVEGPPGDLVMLGKTSGTLQRNVLNDIYDIVGKKDFKWINRQQGELKLLGRRVYCVGANNEDAEARLRGATFAGAYCDEASLYPQSVFNQLMARLSVPGACSFLNTNPESPFHWFYTDVLMNPKITNKKIWHFNMDDNLSLDATYVSDLKAMYTGVWYKRMIEGLWVVAEGAVYDMFDPSKHMVDTSTYDLTKSKLIVACDYATSSVMSWGFYARLPNGLFLKLKEFYYDAVKEAQQKTDYQFGGMFDGWLAGKKPWVVYVDPSAASWIAELRTRGYRVLPANNDVTNGIREVATRLNTGKFLMDKQCVMSEKEYQGYSWDPKAQERGEDRPIKRNDHTCDTDRYAIYTEVISGMSGTYDRR